MWKLKQPRLRELHNCSYQTKAKISGCFIIHLKYFQVVNIITTSQRCFKTFSCQSAQFRIIRLMLEQVLVPCRCSSKRRTHPPSIHTFFNILAFVPFTFYNSAIQSRIRQLRDSKNATISFSFFVCVRQEGSHSPRRSQRRLWKLGIRLAACVEASNVINDPKCNKGPKCNNFWP